MCLPVCLIVSSSGLHTRFPVCLPASIGSYLPTHLRAYQSVFPLTNQPAWFLGDQSISLSPCVFVTLSGRIAYLLAQLFTYLLAKLFTGSFGSLLIDLPTDSVPC